MICKKCNKDKKEEDFVFRNKIKGIKHSICKDCQKEYKRKHYYNNKDQYYTRNIKTNNKINDYIIKYKQTHPCIICGETAIECLDFHHIQDKLKEIALLKRRGSLRKVKEEIEKCVVLCANCHRKVHAKTLII